jgi:hypothetical protein
MPLLYPSTAHNSMFEPTTSTKINHKSSRYTATNGASSNTKNQRVPLQVNSSLLANCQIYSTTASVSLTSHSSTNNKNTSTKVKRSSSLRSVTPSVQPININISSSISRNRSLSIMQKLKLKNDDSSTTITTSQSYDLTNITTNQETTILLSMAPLLAANLSTQSQQQLIDMSSIMTNMSQYDNSDNCSCFLCESILSDKRNSLIYNYEITPNDYSDHSYMKFSYGKPFSQLSCMKLFNLMNTDCTIYYNESNMNNQAADDTQQNNTSMIPNEKYFFHVHNNRPPIYDTRYLYIIDCRLDRKKYERSHINTSIHYSDLLNDDIYLSPPLDHYTIIVLYDDDGTYLTSSNVPIQQKRLPHTNKKLLERQESSDLLITKIKDKLNSYNGVLYLLSGGFEQFSVSYPFSCSNIDIRSTVDRYKHLIIYPNCVLENQIFIGTGIQAKNWKIIRDLNITHIINCSIEHECIFSDAIKYLHCKLEDSLEESICKELEKAYRFIDNALNCADNNNGNDSDFENENSTSSGTSQQARILIHCNLGISRSSSILIAYLMRKYKICLYSTFNYVKDKRNQIAPNYSFLKQLKYFEEKSGH